MAKSRRNLRQASTLSDLVIGLRRSYSLLNDSAERDVYKIGVQLDPKSEGGLIGKL